MDIRRWAARALALGVVAAVAACNEGLPTAPPPTLTLEPGVTVTLDGAQGSTRTYRLTVPPGAGKLRLLMLGFSGDADLAARFGAAPEPGAADCESASEFGLEECIIDAPQAGTWFVSVFGYTAFRGAELTAELPTQVGERALTAGVPVTGLSGRAGDFEMFRLTLPAGLDSLVVTLDATGDPDLYLDLNQYPLLNDYACASFTETGVERCTIVAPPAGTWMVRVDAYTDFTGGTLTATTFGSATP